MAGKAWHPLFARRNVQMGIKVKYFSISVDDNYVPPSPLGWWGVIDRKTLERKKRSQMQKHMLFQIESHMQMVFTDIIMFPCFLVSELVMNVIKKYDQFINFERIIFYDKSKKKSMIYYLPFLNKIELKKSSTHVKENVPVISREELGEYIIMETIYDDKTYIVMRIDLVESMLRRGVIGIGLKEIIVN